MGTTIESSWENERLKEELARVTKQRDELLVAASKFVFDFDCCRSSGEWPVESMYKLRTAIANVKDKP